MLSKIASAGVFFLFLFATINLYSDTSDIKVSEKPRVDVEDGEKWSGRVVWRILRSAHYSPPLSKQELCGRVVENYIEVLDPHKIIFSEEEMGRFCEDGGARLESDIKEGSYTLEHDIYEGAKVGILQALERVGFCEIEEGEDFKFSLFNSEAGRGGCDGLRRFFLKGMFTRGWDRQELLRNLKDQRERIFNLGRNRRTALFISSLAGAYDKNSSYHPREQHRYIVSQVSMNPSGVGVEVSRSGSGVIEDIVKGAPADRSGVVFTGDQVISVSSEDGTKHSARTSADKFNELLSPEEGKMVELAILDRDHNVVKVSLKSETLPVQRHKMVNGCVVIKDGRAVGVLRIPSFYSRGKGGEGREVGEDVRETLEELKKSGIVALVVDVRQDAGGSLEAAVDGVGMFLDGVVYYTSDRNGTISKKGTSKPSIYDGPLVVLTSAGTASAAEVFAKALQAHGRGVVVGGRRTFGKGSVQNLIDLDWHGGWRYFPGGGAGSLRTTTRMLFGPDGEGLQGRGVVPDVVLPCPHDIALVIAERNRKTEKAMGPGRIEVFSQKQNSLGWKISPVRLKEVVSQSKKRLSGSPDFDQVKTLTAKFDELIKNGLVAGTAESYALKTEPFKILGNFLKKQSELEEIAGECDTHDYTLTEAVAIAFDLTLGQ